MTKKNKKIYNLNEIIRSEKMRKNNKAKRLYTLNEFKEGKIVILCKRKNEFDELMKKLDKTDILWAGKEKPSDADYESYGSGKSDINLYIAYYVSGIVYVGSDSDPDPEHNTFNYLVKKGYTIIEPSQLIIDSNGVDSVHINNITFTNLDGSEIEIPEYVNIKKGSRLWAFKMLDEGKKITNNHWRSYPKGHVFVKDNILFNGKGQSKAVFYLNNDDGWELYEEEPKKTVTLREAIEKKIPFILGGAKHRSNGDTVKDLSTGFALSLEYIFCNLDKEVEIIE